ncbi:MAG: UDP-N-acetylmuramate dehydrogenase [Deltaproteobacteria bacterium]
MFYPVRGNPGRPRAGGAMGPVEEVFGARMREFTTIGIGGPADRMLFPHSPREVQEILGRLSAAGDEPLALGAGSNLLVADAGIRATVLCLKGNLGRVLFAESGSVVAEAGTMLPRFAVLCALSGLSGAEELAGIPGTVGGGITMNAGAFGRSIGQILEWAEVATFDGGLARIPGKEIGWGYRECRLPVRGILVRAGFRLAPSPTDRVFARMKEQNEKRRATQPWGMRTFGSIFRNPEGQEAGRLLDGAGMKGAREGDLSISEKHANFMVNRGRGHSRDALRLMERCREAVRRCYGVTLVPEVRIWGRTDD